ncbi:MAG: PilZ domain-containing protein [Cyanobacteria bacterium SIG28]|nr:PilZ domain-containing protein [Cyanobacteria bacterium SIG28]
MERNILNDSDITKIYLVFVDGNGIKRKEPVKLRYMEKKNSFFAGQQLTNFKKPRWRTKADIIVYTSEGIYSANVIMHDTTYALQEIMYNLDTPKTWNFKQLRAGTRKKINLPVKITFSDGLEIESETLDLSVGGFSMLSNTKLGTIHRRFNHRCTIQFSKNDYIYFPNCVLEAEIKFAREKVIREDYELEGYSLYGFKFVNLNSNTIMNLKGYLIKH